MLKSQMKNMYKQICVRKFAKVLKIRVIYIKTKSIFVIWDSILLYYHKYLKELLKNRVFKI